MVSSRDGCDELIVFCLSSWFTCKLVASSFSGELGVNMMQKEEQEGKCKV